MTIPNTAILDETNTEEQVAYFIFLRDRADNKSNTVYTDPVKIHAKL